MLELLAVVALGKFPGGSLNEFVDLVAKSTNGNVVASQGWVRPIAKFEMTADRSELNRILRRDTDMRITPGVDWIFSDEMLPPMRVPGVNVGQVPQPTWKALGADHFQDGRVTFRTEGNERLNSTSLADAPFEKPVQIHWMLQEFPVAVDVRGMEPRQFLIHVARSVGGSFQNLPNAYRLELEPTQMRTRAINMLELKQEGMPTAATAPADQPAAVMRERNELLIALLRELNPQQIAQAFATSDGFVEAQLNPQGAFGAALARALEGGVAGRGFNSQQLTVTSPRGTVMINTRMPIFATLRANFSGQVRLATINERGQAGPPLNINLTDVRTFRGNRQGGRGAPPPTP
jgi:hypothetical protein